MAALNIPEVVAIAPYTAIVASFAFLVTGALCLIMAATPEGGAIQTGVRPCRRDYRQRDGGAILGVIALAAARMGARHG